MMRGSAPGERRGGRQRGTPNRRSVLTDRILIAAAQHPGATLHALQCALLTDRDLPPDTRLALAGHPVRTRLPRVKGGSPGAKTTAAVAWQEAERYRAQMLEAQWTIACDVSLPAEIRRRSAYRFAETLLPKVASRSRWPEAAPDECGFAIHPDIAREYLDARRRLQLTALTAPERKKLERRIELIRRRYASCPSRYGAENMDVDLTRLARFETKRNDGVALTPAEDAEEAHRRLRFDSYAFGPQGIARSRRRRLEEKDTELRRLGNRLPRQEDEELWFLRILYRPYSPLPLKRPKPREWDESEYHPFQDYPPAADGNFYGSFSHSQIYPWMKLPQPDAPATDAAKPPPATDGIEARLATVAAKPPRERTG